MSDNFSLEEIMKKAEEIRARADEQIAQTEKSLDVKANTAIDDVVVDAELVRKTVEEIAHREDDVKEFGVDSTKPVRKDKTQSIKLGAIKKLSSKGDATDDDDDADMKIAPNFSKIKAVRIDDEDDADMKVVPDRKIEHTRQVVLKSKAQKIEEDLDGVPVIVARDKVEKVLGNFSDTEDEPEAIQMMFDGFDDEVDKVETIDESVAEQILKQNRVEKVDKFRLFGPNATDKALNSDDTVQEDYVDRAESKDFLRSLIKRRKAIDTKLIATAILGVPLALLTLLKDSAYFPDFLSGHITYFAAALVFIIATVVVNFNVIIHGFNFKKGLNFDLPISALTILILIHTSLIMLNESLWIDNGVLLGSVACFGMFMSQLGKRQMMVRIIDNFKFISSRDDNYTVENIANEVDAGIIARGVLDGDPIIKNSVKTDMATNFMEISCRNEPADKLSRILSPIMLALSLILLIIVGIIDNFNTGINCAICALAISTPFVSLFLTNDMLYDLSVALDKTGSRVCGYEGALMAGNADAMVMEAADLFGKNGCDLLGMKTFNNANEDSALLMTAAVIIKVKSPLAGAFGQYIIGKQSLLPKVEDTIYEDRMGISAWVNNSKVLVGTRDLLIRHNVAVPMESFEYKYTSKGWKVLYLAVGGNIVAMFVVSYSADPDLKRALRKLEKSGISLIVKSCDPYITEDSLAELYGLPKGYIHVMNHSSARAYDKYSNMVVEESPAYIVHNGTALGFISAMRGAGVAIGAKRLIEFFVSFGVGLGFLVVALLSILGGYDQITAFGIILFQLIWHAFVILVSKLRRAGI